MKRLAVALAIGLLGGILASAAQAADEFDQYRIESASVSLPNPEAGAHSDFTTTLALSEKESAPYAQTRDVVVELPPGLVGNPEAFPKCSVLEFGTDPVVSKCPFDSQIGSIELTLGPPNAGTFSEPIYNMPAPGGDVVARFGFYAAFYPTFLNVRLDPETHALIASVEGASSAASFIAAAATFWGVPGDKSHDADRITPLEANTKSSPPGGRSSNLPDTPFMTNPTRCGVERQVKITATSYQRPNSPQSATAPFPQIVGCGAAEFNPSSSLAPTTSQGTSGSGLDYTLDFPVKGFEVASLNVASEMKRAEVILPEGMTVNPSQAEGLGVCSEADLARETYDSGPNAGCPESSKIGSVIATTPVLDRDALGSLYLAKPYENPFGSLLALYMLLKVPDRGVLVKLKGEVRLDPATGRLTTVFDDVPELPVAQFDLHFREGARAPLVTPAACGAYTAISNLNPWSAPGKTLVKTNSFDITSGPDHGPCPSGGLPPFKPGLTAGSTNNAAGAYSPFDVRLTRSDAEQEITNFSIKLPPGITGKLAGIPFCPDSAIAAAKARTGVHGGAEELAAPACPAASEVGRSLAGAGVGQVLVYVPGKIYLAGPYRGSPLSIVAVTAAKAGPFDLGTVVLREALRINPETAEVFVDATDSDPIPHIIQGVPVRLRDIRAYVDRPNFALNPTNCTRTSTASTVRGAGLDFTSEADNDPITVISPYQAANCASLGYKPRLALKLKGSTKRGGNPALTAILRPRPGDANSKRVSVALPHSEFLDQSHIKTICTRVQFKAGAGNGAECPAGSVYGKVKAWTPLLSDPLEGNVYLRSSEHPLPDLVLALHGLVDFTAVGRIDSVNGGIRNTFEAVPDAPITKVEVSFAGGKKGLLENSTSLCVGKHRAKTEYTAHNGREYNAKVALKPTGCKKHKKAK